MIPIFEAALEVQSFCEHHRWRFCFIGGVAVQRWGEQRATDDVDLTLLTGFGGEETFVDACLGRFRSREPEERANALRRRVLFLVSDAGVNLDIALGAIPFEIACVERSSRWDIGSQRQLRTCSAEDLLVHKCFASRDRDWTDVEGILIRQWGKLDLQQVRRGLKPLADLKESPEIIGRLEMMLQRLQKSPVLPQWPGL